MFDADVIKDKRGKKVAMTENKKDNKKSTKAKDVKSKVPPPMLRGEPGNKMVKNPAYAELVELFKAMDLPEKLVPKNVVDYHYDRSSGNIKIRLSSGFEKAFDKENVLKFDSVIEGRLKHGEFTRITGIHRGSASIVSVHRSRPGHIAITGKLGFFHKTIEFADSVIPDLP